MKTYKATATREDKWWVVNVEGVGVTQGLSTSEAETMAIDLVSAMLDVPVDEVSVDIEFQVPGLDEEIVTARRAGAEAARAQEEAAAKSRQVVRHILEKGLSQRDAARVLGVSAQRVSQLVADERCAYSTLKVKRTRRKTSA